MRFAGPFKGIWGWLGGPATTNVDSDFAAGGLWPGARADAAAWAVRLRSKIHCPELGGETTSLPRAGWSDSIALIHSGQARA